MNRALILTSTAVFIGFVVGFGVGQSVRSNTNNNVSAKYDDGKVIIVADIEQALKSGLSEFFSGLAT